MSKSSVKRAGDDSERVVNGFTRCALAAGIKVVAHCSGGLARRHTRRSRSSGAHSLRFPTSLRVFMSKVEPVNPIHHPNRCCACNGTDQRIY